MAHLRTLCAIGLQLFAYVVGIGCFLGTFLVVAKLISHPTVAISLALLTAFISVALLSWPAGKVFKTNNTRRYTSAQAGVTTQLLMLLVWTVLLQPLIPKSDQFVRPTPAGVEFWELPTGSRIAVRKVNASSAKRNTPIIFLHGGPGAYAVGLEQTWRAIAPLSVSGHDVYFYDQIGGGLSDRLEDIAQYTLDRHIADLRAIRQRTGSEQVILIGSSFGATLASNYMAKYPQDVVKAVFSGAGPIYLPDWKDRTDGSLDDRMSEEEKIAFDRAISRPRLMAAIVLAEIDPVIAARFLPSREAGSFFDKIANEHYLKYAVCNVDNLATRAEGFGFWSNRMTGKSLSLRTDDPKPTLRNNRTPVLVLRGQCDYKSEAVARQYADVFPNASYANYVDGGHMLYWEKPNEFVEHILGFLSGTATDH